jgi:hypothetical protein
MSKIFEALETRNWCVPAKLRRNRQRPRTRRNSRPAAKPALAARHPVYVYGHDPGKEPFHEEAHTLNVSAMGALLLLSVPVRKGTKLLLTNQLTQKEQDCRVVVISARGTAGPLKPASRFRNES